MVFLLHDSDFVAQTSNNFFFLSFSLTLRERYLQFRFICAAHSSHHQWKHMASLLWIQHLEQFVWMVDQTVAIKIPQKQQEWHIFLSAVGLWSKIVMKMSSLTVTYCGLSRLPFRLNNSWMLKDCSISRNQTPCFRFLSSTLYKPTATFLFLSGKFFFFNASFFFFHTALTFFMAKIGHWMKPHGIKKMKWCFAECCKCNPWIFSTNHVLNIWSY